MCCLPKSSITNKESFGHCSLTPKSPNPIPSKTLHIWRITSCGPVAPKTRGWRLILRVFPSLFNEARFSKEQTYYLPNISVIFIFPPFDVRRFTWYWFQMRSQCKTYCVQPAPGYHALFRIDMLTLPQQQIICHLNVLWYTECHR